MKLEKRINRAYATFNEIDCYIAKEIINHKKQVEQYTIHQFAQMIHVSQSALTRFAKKIGLQGYKEIKSLIRIECMEKKDTHLHTHKELRETYHQVISSLQKQSYSSLFDELYKAKRILIFADGFAMSKVASECKRIFLPLHKKVFYIHGFDMMQSFLSLAQKEDIAFLFSFKGENKELISFATSLQMKGCLLVSITQMKANGLAQISNYNLYAFPYEFPNTPQGQLQSCTSFYLLIELFLIQYQFHCEHNFKR